MKILIGNTGLVGQTLKESINFDFEYNSKSIHSYSPPNGCDLYLSCLPSTKWLINKDTKTDKWKGIKIKYDEQTDDLADIIETH